MMGDDHKVAKAVQWDLSSKVTSVDRMLPSAVKWGIWGKLSAQRALFFSLPAQAGEVV